MENNTQNGKFYAEIEKFVNTTCQALMAPLQDWESIDYRHKGSTGESFLKMTDSFGDSYFFNVSDMGKEDIVFLIAAILAGIAVNRQVVNKEARREAAALFG